jgi:hypothetical protein
MTQALANQLPQLQVFLGGFASVLKRLATEWAVTVVHAPLPPIHVGVFDPATRTVQLRADAPLEDQLAFLTDVWWLLTVGPHATRWIRRQPHLQLVPAPRVGA